MKKFSLCIAFTILPLCFSFAGGHKKKNNKSKSNTAHISTKVKTVNEPQSTENNQYSLHKVEPKETWYGISRTYGISVNDLQQMNSGIKSLRTGETIKVPSIGTAANTAKKAPTAPLVKGIETTKAPSEDIIGKTHVVLQGETMYHISKVYNVTIVHLKEWNGLKTEDVRVGQTIYLTPDGAHVAYANEEKVFVGKVESNIPQKPVNTESAERLVEKLMAKSKEVPVNTAPKPLSTPVKEPAAEKAAVIISKEPVTKKEDPYVVPTVKQILAKPEDKSTQTIAGVPINTTKSANAPAASNGMKEVTEKGAAAWINDEDTNPNKFYALHRTAKVGTIIKVVNTLNNQSVFVKVVGALPDTPDNASIIIKISKAAASRLEAGDSKFQAELNYGIMQ